MICEDNNDAITSPSLSPDSCRVLLRVIFFTFPKSRRRKNHSSKHMQCHCASVYRCLARSITIAIFELSPAIETPCRQNYKFVGRIAAKMRPIPVHVSRSVVCGFPSVFGTPVNLAETAELIEMQFGGRLMQHLRLRYPECVANRTSKI